MNTTTFSDEHMQGLPYKLTPYATYEQKLILRTARSHPKWTLRQEIYCVVHSIKFFDILKNPYASIAYRNDF